MADDLHSLIAGVLQQMTRAELSEAPQRVAGLIVPNADGLSRLKQGFDSPWERQSCPKLPISLRTFRFGFLVCYVFVLREAMECRVSLT